MKKLGYIIAAILLVYAIFFREKAPFKKILPKTGTKKTKAIKNKNRLGIKQGPEQESTSNHKAEQKESPASEMLKIEEQEKISKEVLNTFKSETKMVIPSLPNMSFSQVDIDNDDIAIVHGETRGTNRTLTVIATRGVITAEKALEFLKEEGHLLPNFGKDGLSLARKPYSIPSVPGKGFTKNHYVFIGKPNSSGLTTNGILMTREDGKGTYLYLLKTHKDFFDKNEGLMDRLYDEIKLSDKK